MDKTLFLLLLFLLGVSCGTQRKLQKTYSGKPVSALHEKFGNPKTIIGNENDSVYIFEKTEELRSTEISQGKLTLDPIVTPKVNKTERFYFTVKNGIIVKTRFEEEYER